jgi:hypothetical protein
MKCVCISPYPDNDPKAVDFIYVPILKVLYCEMVANGKWQIKTKPPIFLGSDRFHKMFRVLK